MADEGLDLQVSNMRYDITMPLFDGRVQIEGVTLKPMRIPAMIFNEDSPYKDGSFGIADLNVMYWLPAIEAGWQIIGLPLWVKRKPVYEYVFCRTDRGINSPKDLEGKRIGSRPYRLSTTIWLKGLLQHRHGVDISTFRWVIWGNEIFPLHDQNARIEAPSDPQKTPVDALLDGDVDAIMTDISDTKLFQTLENSPSVKRLFPDYMAEDRKLYDETGIFTPAHMMVMSRKLDQEHPELARKVYDAFEKAKAMAYDDILSDRAGFSTVYLREALLEQMKKWGDPWKYGMSANRREIDTFIQYNREQGLVSRDFSYADVFAEGTLDT
jgi:4,5-dihydroxyphthalate decarboxylase